MISALSPFSYGEVWELAVMHQNYSSLEPKITQLQGFKVLGGVRDFKVTVAGSGLIISFEALKVRIYKVHITLTLRVACVY